MTDLVSVASNAVASYQRALGTVSNNIANVATEGYSRQEVVLQSNPTAKIGNVYLGTGVMIDRVKRQYDTFAELNLRNSNSDLASQEPIVSYASRVIDIMGSSSMGLNSALDKFFNTSRELSADPASTIKRSSFIRDAQGLGARFGQLSSQLDLIQNETDEAINSYVSEVNTLSSQIAQVNQQMTRHKTAEAQPPDLLDQRDLLLNKLSSYARLNTHFNENGSVDISLGASQSREVIVSGRESIMIGVQLDDKNPGKVTLVLDPYGSKQPLSSISSGKISGMLSFREQILGTSRNSLNSLATQLVNEINDVHEAGVDGYGNAGTSLFKIGNASENAAANVQIVFEDPLRVACASQFRVIESPQNTSGVDANLIFKEPELAGPPLLTKILGNNEHPDAGVSLTITGASAIGSVATVPNGLKNIELFLSGADGNQQLQVFTRDGRQLGGTEITDDAMRLSLLTEENGFATNASYNSDYLNGTDVSAYKDLEVFYGVRATVGRELNWDMSEADPTQHIPSAATPIPAVISGYRIPPGQTYMAGGMLKMNGESLTGNLVASGDIPLQASQFATWINNSDAAYNDHIEAVASNQIVIRANQIDLNKSLILGNITLGNYGQDVVIDPSKTATNVSELADSINAETYKTGVLAEIDDFGNLVLTNQDGNDIIVKNPGNALGLANTTYTGQLTLTRSLISGENTPIEITFDEGSPSDLAKLGFSTGVYITSTSNDVVGEDLLVFVTGAGQAAVSASFTGTPVTAKQSLRADTFVLTFDTPDPVTGNATHFTLTDKATGTVVASRDFNPLELEPGFKYLGLEMSFSNPPAVGDTFEINGNQDGTANNENILQLAAIESSAISSGGKTIGAAYIDHVNDIGNITRQATIAQSALTVVHDQAVASRDQVSGVSLDDEAADLIRYQQAYQAAAKILQISSQLFDSVLQVR
jgi:flagellar hook-associated protein FlgK